MDRLTEQQRRRIYEEEKKREEARRSRASNRWSVGCLVAIGVVVLLMVAIVTLARAGALDGIVGQDEAEAGAATGDRATSAPTRPPAPAAGARTSFGDGAWLVGTEIVPGTYRTDGPSSRCYWALLAEFSNVKAFLDRSEAASSADPGPEIGADQVIVVQIGAGDAAFETIGCGTWRRAGGSGQE